MLVCPLFIYQNYMNINAERHKYQSIYNASVKDDSHIIGIRKYII